MKASSSFSYAADSPCESLPWDSEFFHMRIARLSGRRLTENSLSAAFDWCRAERTECLYFLASPDDPLTLSLAEREGFHLVDVRVTLSRALADEISPSPSVRALQSGDLPALLEIASVSHTASRFYFDGRFPRDRCGELYREWLRKSSGPPPNVTLVVEHQGAPAGYVTCDCTDGAGEIGLLAVAAWARGNGLGWLLVQAALAHLQKNGAKKVSVVTQGRNLGALRLYERHGFTTQSLELWYHRWFPRNG